jgi:hypothetical protein
MCVNVSGWPSLQVHKSHKQVGKGPQSQHEPRSELGERNRACSL